MMLLAQALTQAMEAHIKVYLLWIKSYTKKTCGWS